MITSISARKVQAAAAVSAVAAAGVTDVAGKDACISGALAAAAWSLLGTSTPSLCRAAEPERRWDLDSALLYYGESDGRVQDKSFNALLKRDFGDERALNLDLTMDSLTGASPSGAIVTDSVQTFTRASGQGSYSTPAGEIPLDNTFHDTRFAADATWSQPLARLYTLTAGVGFSTEYDYQHTGANFGMTRDFNRRNTTVSAALAYAKDTVKPVGGTPLPLTTVVSGPAGDGGGGGPSSDSKDVLDVLLGMTQVLGRHTLMRVNLSYSDSSGYLTDPYKILSVVDPVTGELVTIPPQLNGQPPIGIYRYESRPDSRRMKGLYAELRHDFSGRVLQLGYRYSTDDWKIDSHTLEARWRLPMGEFNYLEPHARFYTQTAASFYRYSLPDEPSLPQFASADARLGALDTTTIGLKFGHRMASGNEMSVRLELYRQKGKLPTSQLIGAQVANAKLPDFNAVIVQAGYHFKL